MSEPRSLDWLSFVLNPELLGKTLSQETIDKELLYPIFVECSKQLFLHQQPTMNFHSVRKSSVLRIVLLQLGAHFQWDLQVLEELLPLPFLYNFFETLLQSAKINDIEGLLNKLDDLTAVQSFITALYCRWILKTVLNLSIPGNSPPSQFLQMTSEDTKMVQVNTEGIMSRLSNLSAIAVQIVEKLAFSEKNSELSEVLSHAAFSLDSDFNVIIRPVWTANSRKSNLILALTEYYIFTQEYEKSTFYCSRFMADEKNHSQEMKDAMEGFALVLGLRVSSQYQQQQQQPSSAAAVSATYQEIEKNKPNIELRVRNGFAFNVEYLRLRAFFEVPSISDSDYLIFKSCFKKEGPPRMSSHITLSRMGDSNKKKNPRTKKRELLAELFYELDDYARIITIVHELNKHYKSLNTLHLTIRWQTHSSSTGSKYLNILLSKMAQLKRLKKLKKVKEMYSTIRELSTQEPEKEDSIDFFCALLNDGQWECLLDKSSKSGLVQNFYNSLASLALDIANKRASKILCDILVPLFQCQKRTSQSLITTAERQEVFFIISKVKHPFIVSLLGSFLLTLYNIGLDDTNIEIANNFSNVPPFAITISSNSLNLDLIVTMLKVLCNPWDKDWLQVLGEIFYIRRDFAVAIKYLLESIIVSTTYFLKPFFEQNTKIVKKLVRCSSELGQHCQALLLSQLLNDTDYATAFRSFEERINTDAMDALYPFIWDITMLEYSVTMHSKRGEFVRKKHGLEAINQLELNTNNNDEILSEASTNRRTKFLRRMSSCFL